MAKRKERPLLTWVYDTREQEPYQLAIPSDRFFDDGGYYITDLPEGDITCELNMERLPIVIERKALNDYLNCCGRERPRFDNELARLAAYQIAHIIVESPFAQIKAGSRYSLMNGLSAINSIAHWETVYPNIHFHPVTNRIEGQVWARTLLQEFAKHHWALRD